MNVMNALCQAYKYLEKYPFDYENGNLSDVLLPISHTYQNTEIEITINPEGNLVAASVVGKNDREIIIPCTSESASRTGSRAVPNPLVDKLSYLAGDYLDFYPSDKKEIVAELHDMYMENLHKWNSSQYAHPKIKLIEQYLAKNQLCRDLVKFKILEVDETGTVKKYDKAFVRFTVLNNTMSGEETENNTMSGKEAEHTWRNKFIYDSWIDYYASQKANDEKVLSYVSGTYDAKAGKAPKRIRNAADNAKIISSNDTQGFTYLGRFKSADDAASIGYEDMQHMHNALRYLIKKQGFSIGMLSIVAWETNNMDIPNLIDNSLGILGEDDLSEIVTNEAFAKKLELATKGYKQKLEPNSEVNIIGLNSFDLKGRMSISYYDSVSGSDYVDHIMKWHRDCSWMMTYFSNKRKCHSISAPTALEIARVMHASQGMKDTSPLIYNTVSRIISTIIKGGRIPQDIVKTCVCKISNRNSFKNDMEYAHALEIVCAIVKKYRKDYRGEVLEMSLDRNKTDRSYLYGRLLAVAQKAEEGAMWAKGTPLNHPTSAENLRYMFSRNPERMWPIIHEKITPYLNILKKNHIHKYEDELMEIHALLNTDCKGKGILNELYLIGYYCELMELNKTNVNSTSSNGV